MKCWVVRDARLLALEGWYDTPVGRIKLSCRFKDIMRASRSRHFISCFGEGRSYSNQRRLRCERSEWAVVYLPDKHGDFMARAWVHLVDTTLIVDKVYGNKLTGMIIADTLEKILSMKKLNLICRPSGTDTYLSG